MKLFISAVLILAMMIASSIAKAVRKDCSKADIVFIMDESSSIWPQPFLKQKKFIKDVIDMFEIGVNQTRVGLVRFSTKGRVGFLMNKHHDKASLNAAVDSIVQRGGNTNTGDALYIARTQEFVKKNGGRPGNPAIPQIGIVITDGNSQEEDETKSQARWTRKAGVTVFAIGIGGERQISLTELNNIASGPKFVFTVNNYDALDSIKRQLGYKACELGKVNDACNDKKMDIAFAIDTAKEVSDDEFNHMVGVIQGLIYSMDIGKDTTRVSAMTFSGSTRTQIGLGKINERRALYEALARLTRQTGMADTAGAFQALSATFNPKNGGRTKVTKVAVLITNGKSVDSAAAVQEARNMYEKYGVEAIVLAVGDDVDNSELLDIAGNDHIIRVLAYEDLSTRATRNVLAEVICPLRPPMQDFACGELHGADVTFVMDTNSAGLDDVIALSDFMQDVTQKFDIGPNKIQISVVPNECHQLAGFDLKTYATKDDVLRAMNMDKKSTTTALLSGLATEYFTPVKGASRPSNSTKRIAILVTDEKYLKGTQQAAQKAREAAHVEIFVIGVGKVDRKALEGIADSPSSRHVFLVDNYEALAGNSILVGALTGNICVAAWENPSRE